LKKEPQRIIELFNKLMSVPLRPLRTWRRLDDVPIKPGVYVICDPRGSFVRVGMAEGRLGLQGRLTQHRDRFRKRNPQKYQKQNHQYRCLVVLNPRKRALLEAYATGSLCPREIRLGEEELAGSQIVDAPAADGNNVNGPAEQGLADEDAREPAA
jgi:hypothetical protein